MQKQQHSSSLAFKLTTPALVYREPSSSSKPGITATITTTATVEADRSISLDEEEDDDEAKATAALRSR